jgi:hypothetical protein
MSVTRRVALVALGALVIVLGLGAISIVRSEGAAAPNPSPTATPGVQTLLLQLLDSDGYARGNVVMGVEPLPARGGADMLVVPASLLVPQGDDTVTLGTTPQSSDTLAGVTAVELALRVRIDAGLTLDRLAFAGLIDSVGGLRIELEQPVLLPAIGAGDRRRVLGPGVVSLDGIAAADYALLRLPGESEEALTERLLGVLIDVFARLPITPEGMRQVLTSLGSLAPSTVPTEELAPVLLAVRADAARGQVRTATLPVDVIRGGARPAAVSTPEGEVLVQELFPDARISDDDTGMTG